MKLCIPAVAGLLLIVSLTNGDVYLHNLRGSNNSLNEAGTGRRNANRMFDSQTIATPYLVRNRNFLRGVPPFKERMQGREDAPVQQSDYLKRFMLIIAGSGGLSHAYHVYADSPPGPCHPTIKFSSLREMVYDVIIVGAGMAGLSAAYELKRAGLNVKILEQTKRYGGRVFTYADCAGLAPGLYGEAGAMRFPGKVDDPTDRAHFLTDGYIKKFGLNITMFPNYDPNGITNIYGMKAKTNDWGKKYFDNVWPRWRDGIKNIEINDIGEYYEKTTEVVTKQLIQRLKRETAMEREVVIWAHWIDIWSQFTLESFLESNIHVILAKIPEEDKKDLDIHTLACLLPWSNDALRGYSVSTYTQQLDQSLVQYLREQLGKWWSDNMHTLVGGMHSLPKAFFSDGVLGVQDIDFNKQVTKISYRSHPSEPNHDRVEVACYPSSSYGPERTYKARAVIVTTPVNILRQISFKPLLEDEETKVALMKNLQAIEDIYTGPATKIILQTRTRFWENNATYNIQGGFSKTNLPIGQMHYVKPDPQYVDTKQGIILIYTWKNEALSFGSLPKELAIQKAIEQIAEIHPEINQKEGEVEIAIVHAWYNQPSYQGAYGLMKTTQFNNIRYLWHPMGNVYFSGDNLSFVPGWIEGALESGLKSAYQVYARHMKKSKCPIKGRKGKRN